MNGSQWMLFDEWMMNKNKGPDGLIKKGYKGFFLVVLEY